MCFKRSDWENVEQNPKTAYHCLQFKDKSKYIELPCKVGDEIYYIPDYYIGRPQLLVGTITDIRISSDDYGVLIWQTPYNGYFMGKNFNVKWFTERNTAEQKLKELKENA